MKFPWKVWLIGVMFILLLGAGKRFYLSEYEEECNWYRIDTINEVKCCDWTRGICNNMFNETHMYKDDYWPCDNFTFWNRRNTSWMNVSNVCIKYHLVRRVGE